MKGWKWAKHQAYNASYIVESGKLKRVYILRQGCAYSNQKQWPSVTKKNRYCCFWATLFCSLPHSGSCFFSVTLKSPVPKCYQCTFYHSQFWLQPGFSHFISAAYIENIRCSLRILCRHQFSIFKSQTVLLRSAFFTSFPICGSHRK